MAGQAIGGYLSSRKNRGTRWYKNTAQGKEQLRISREGKYSPQALQTLLGRQGSALGQGANRQRVNLRGFLANRGMENSIAGAGQLRAIDAGVGERQAEYSSELGVENELAKNAARLQYAQGSDAYGAMQRGQNQQQTTDLMTGIGSAGTSAAGTYQQGQQMSQYNDLMGQYEAAISAGDKPKADQIAAMLMSLYGGG